MIKVFGHLSPDTDATVSAAVWAWYLNEHTSNNATAYVLGELNTETAFVLERWNIPMLPVLDTLTADDTVVVVDTNNPQELPDNLNEADIIEMIDHHKLVGGIETNTPISITMRPVASTATIIYDLLTERDIDLPESIKGLLLSAILSDTLGFRSPTTTPHDKDIAETLAASLNIEINSYANEMFAAKSDISGFTDSGLIKLDSKKYKVSDKNFRVSVIETTNPETVLARKDGLIQAIETCIAEESDIDDVLFFIVDIFKEEATVLTYNELTKQVVAASFGVTVDTDTEVLPGVVSRKKQILPTLTL